MDDSIRAEIHFQHEQGAFYGSEYQRTGLEKFFSKYSTFDNKSGLKVGDHISVLGDVTLHEISDIFLKMKHLEISENPRDFNSPVEMEIWVIVKNIED